MNLTDDWKAEKLKGWYFILDIHGAIAPDFIYEDTTLKNLARKEVKEVLAPCDYEELKGLKQELRQTLIGYRNQTIAKEKAEEENKRLGKLARENFRAFEEKCDLYNKLQSITAKLDVAVKALENISKLPVRVCCDNTAQEALTAIRGDK